MNTYPLGKLKQTGQETALENIVRVGAVLLVIVSIVALVSAKVPCSPFGD